MLWLEFFRETGQANQARSANSGRHEGRNALRLLRLTHCRLHCGAGRYCGLTGLSMQERDGGNPAWRLPRLLVSILLARRVAAAALSPFAGWMCGRPPCAALVRRGLSLARKPPLVRPPTRHPHDLLDVPNVV